MIYYLDTKSTNPYFNLAFEEYFFNKKKDNEEYLILWQNSDTIVVGKYQNVYEEINLKYTQKNHIKIVRRNSGGGSVFHDLGNLNFSYITDDYKDFSRFITDKIIAALKSIGINAELHGRNDIYMKEFKISGLAQYGKEGKMLIHGTLLVDSNLEKLKFSLTRNSKITDSLADSSKVSKVINITDILNKKISIPEIKDLIISQYTEISEYQVSKEEKQEIELLAKNKYMTEKWNFGYMPECNFSNKKRFKGGLVEVNAIIENNFIKYVEFSGDFFALKDIKELEKKLEGINLVNELPEILSKIKVDDYIKDVCSNDIISLLSITANGVA